MADESGLSGSTAWDNSVRARLYLRRPENAGPDERVLTRAKANYSSGDGDELALLYSAGVFVGLDPNAALVERVALTVRNEVQAAWNAGLQYVEKKGHPRELHGSLTRKLTMPNQPRELVQAGLRAAIDDGLIYPCRTTKKRGWRGRDDE